MSLATKTLILGTVMAIGSAGAIWIHGKREATQRNAAVISSLEDYVARHQSDPAAKTRVEVANVLIDCQSSWNSSVEKCGQVLVDRYGQEIVQHLVAINAAGGFGQASMPSGSMDPSADAGTTGSVPVAAQDPNGYRLGDGQNGR